MECLGTACLHLSRERSQLRTPSPILKSVMSANRQTSTPTKSKTSQSRPNTIWARRLLLRIATMTSRTSARYIPWLSSPPTCHQGDSTRRPKAMEIVRTISSTCTTITRYHIQTFKFPESASPIKPPRPSWSAKAPCPAQWKSMVITTKEAWWVLPTTCWTGTTTTRRVDWRPAMDTSVKSRHKRCTTRQWVASQHQTCKATKRANPATPTKYFSKTS